MKVILMHPGDHPDYHVYDILNIFLHTNVKCVPNSEEIRVILEDDSGKIIDERHIEYKEKKAMKRALYIALCEFTGYSSPWGAITGVRPVKTVNDIAEKYAINEEPNYEAARRELKEFYLADDYKIDLAVETAKNQNRFLLDQKNNPQKADIYVAIPFCPSRCLYCSFTSNSIVKYKHCVDSYLEHLHSELLCCKKIAEKKNYIIDSIYLGGGTPTSFDDEHFEKYMEIIRESLDMSNVTEFALEAGRPDSITPGKLESAKKAGVTRLSINPQTMNEKTLKRIGRAHTVKQVYDAFEISRKAGFYNINTDIIAGLPGESPEDFGNTLDAMRELKPEGLTVHTLSIKRAADLKLDIDTQNELHPEYLAEMTKMGWDFAKEMGMKPFYLYRQKNMLGNHENVGYCLPGHESPYNIHIMEEDKTILAAGAGSVTKFVSNGNIFRVYDVKTVEEYEKRWEEMIEKKYEEAEKI